MLEWLHTAASSPWFYAVIFSIALLDSVMPVVPSETAVIIGGVVAGLAEPQLSLALVIAAGALGAFAGDNLAYVIGLRAGPWVEQRVRSPKGLQRLSWARQQLTVRGGSLLLTARFVPGGRTAVTVSSGLTRQPHPRFAFFVGIAAVIWATYAALLGFIGGKSFEDNHTLAFVVAFSVALCVTGLIELGRWLRHRRQPTSGPSHVEPA